MNRAELIEAIVAKYEAIGENPDTYLEGLLHAKLMNYWDYIEVETLLSLQKPRTPFKDEEIFIIYHQITELVLKLIANELKQITGVNDVAEEILIDKLKRITRYTQMLITSYSVMKDGMSYDDYNTFRVSLAPASGFQSAQFREIELRCTRVQNLINDAGKKRLLENPSMEDYFDHLYWRDAGLNRQTGKMTLTLRQFEEKYKKGFIELAYEMKGQTLEEIIIRKGNLSPELKRVLVDFDQFYNIAWPKVHLKTAEHYLDAKGEEKVATGGSKWKQYLHPKYQQRKFFPHIYTESELANWGSDENNNSANN